MASETKVLHHVGPVALADDGGIMVRGVAGFHVAYLSEPQRAELALYLLAGLPGSASFVDAQNATNRVWAEMREREADGG